MDVYRVVSHLNRLARMAATCSSCGSGSAAALKLKAANAADIVLREKGCKRGTG